MHGPSRALGQVLNRARVIAERHPIAHAHPLAVVHQDAALGEECQSFVEGVRTLRSELNVPWTAALVPHVLAGEGDQAMLRLIEEEAAILTRMGKVGAAVAADAPPAGFIVLSPPGAS